MKEFNAVIFDMDGVIFDSERLVLECWKIIASKYGIDEIEETCKSCMGLNRETTRIKFKERYGMDFPYDEYKEEQRELFFSKPLPIKPGVKEIFETIHERNIKMALASSTSKAVVTSELRNAGLIEYFDALICGDMVAKSKPDPEIYLAACDALHELPKNCYGIEDSINGIKSIVSAKMRPIMVPDMLIPNAEIKDMCEIVLPSLYVVKEYLFD